MKTTLIVAAALATFTPFATAGAMVDTKAAQAAACAKAKADANAAATDMAKAHTDATAADAEKAAALAELQASDSTRCPWFFQILADPRMKPLHDLPGFQELQAILPRMEAAVPAESGDPDGFAANI